MTILMAILMGILMGFLMGILMGIWMMVSMGWPYDSSDCLFNTLQIEPVFIEKKPQ